MSQLTELRADRDRDGADEWTAPIDPDVVDTAIERMDQRRHTEVSLRGHDWWAMLIGGGDDAYVASIQNQMTGESFQLVDPSRPETERVSVVTGGQRGDFPARLVVGRAAVLRAARHFADTNRPAPDLDWLREDLA